MTRHIHTMLFCICTGILIWITCTLPSNQAENPKNSSVSLFLPDGNNTVQQGSHKQIGMRVKYPQHINYYSVTSTCGNFDTTVQASPLQTEDTVILNPQFQTEGTCILKVNAVYLDNSIKDKTDSLTLVVLPGEPALEFSGTPTAFTTHTGTTDTLQFIIDASNVGTVSYTVTCNPEIDSTGVYLITPITGDTVLIHFDPAVADTYSVTLNANAGDLSTSASVIVTVLESLTPNSSENPQTLITGVPDTLVFTLTPEQVASGVIMELLDAEALPTGIATVIPSGTDSILIAVNPAEEGQLSISIVTSNGVLTDTTTYTFTFVDQSNAVWTTTSATVDAVEGQQCSVDLTSYLFEGVLIETIAPTASVGSITSSGTWQYTPPWGSEATVSVTVSGKRGETSQDLSLTLHVAPGDESAPEITLLSPSTESKTVSSSQATVSVVVKDAGAGVDGVTFTTASETFDGSAENDSTWSAVITGLAEGTATEVIITATDKSMKENSSSKTITLTYDPSMEDGEAPVITQTGGTQSGDRVTTATGTLTFTITDDSGVDSVWWTLNDVFMAAVTSSDSSYSISYDLPKFRANVIEIFAKDGATGGNKGSRTITLNYNTEITAVTPGDPEDGATNVLLTPTFTWTGGSDADGDSVFYQVFYGPSAADLSQTTSVVTDSNITLTQEEQLSPTTVYYWQVVAWSKVFPDTVRSDTVSFTTLDPTAEDLTGPPITQTAGTSNGDRVMTATGTITVTIGNDPSGIASVTAKLNDGAEEMLTAGTGTTYSYNYTLTDFGENTVIFTATDGSANSNRIKDTITFNYNTEPTAISLTSPATDETDVSVSPTFKWSGGNDEDGESVTFTVHYGTSRTSLGSRATVSGDTTATVGSPLDYQQTYYWQVTATSTSTVYPDTVTSSVDSFTTEGIMPSISAHPQSQSREEGQSVTFSVTASANGFGTLSYQWREDGSNIDGEDGASYTISSVTTGMNGNMYDCVVTNAVGSDTSSAATLTVSAIPSFTVSFETDGGLPQPQDQTVQRDGFATEPTTDPVRSGYKFTGWYELNASHDFYFTTTPITDDLTIYAGWVEVYTVTYHNNNADGGNVPVDNNEYESGQTVTVAGNTGSLYRDGFSFSGWTTSSGGTGNAVTSVQVDTVDIHLYAKWVQTTYSVTYNANSGTGTVPVDNTSYVSGNTATIKPNSGALVNGSQSFAGWSTTNGTTYTCGQQVTITGNLALFAKYSETEVMDNDGNLYTSIVLAGTQWLAQNLKTTKYRDGSSVDKVAQGDAWLNHTTGAYCWPGNNIANKEYGAIYNWTAVQAGQLAPAGWRLATEDEWTALDAAYDACELRIEDTNYWSRDNCSSTYSFTGFDAIPNGYINYDGMLDGFEGEGQAYWWISETMHANIYHGAMGSNLQITSWGENSFGFGVRCVKE